MSEIVRENQLLSVRIPNRYSDNFGIPKLRIPIDTFSLGAADGRGSRDGEVTGHLISNDATIRFSPISRDRVEIWTRKWCQTTWLVERLQKMCILTYLVHDLTLT